VTAVDALFPIQRRRGIMSKLSNPTARRAWGLVALGLVLSLLVACGGTPEPEIVVVTATNTPEPEVVVVTATFTPEPLVVTDEAVSSEAPLPTNTQPPPPTETPQPAEPPPPTAPPPPTEPPPLEFNNYEHPSGFFDLDIPVGAETEEDEDGIYFTYLDSLVMVFYTDLGTTLSPEDLEGLITVLIEDSLIDEGLITSYSNLSVERSDDGNIVGSVFDATSEDIGEGEGSIILYQAEQTLYIMILITDDYDAIEDVWDAVVSSLSVSPPAPPTNTPKPTAQPTAKPTAQPTAKPKPKPSATPKPSGSSLPADKGCFLFENQMDAEANVTFTAKDWEWSDVVFIAAGESKVYCLDPGRYAATVDVPPPWSGYNEDIEVKAGEHFRWPIYGG
jgi:hypothetical protein